MKVFINIKKLVQVRESCDSVIRGAEMNNLPSIESAWLATLDGVIEAYGSMNQFDSDRFSRYELINCTGKIILPTWVDSHTHIAFADWREQEFTDRISGLTYEEIAQRGGGILNSARKTLERSEDELFDRTWARLTRLIEMGTGAIEIKSGYGLSLEGELKLLRVIDRIKKAAPIPVKATFLGAHAFPTEYKLKHDAYVDLVINEMLPAVVANNLADYTDVFCEKGYFNVSQCTRIIEAAAKHGLKSKIHVNQFNSIGGIAACVEHVALTVDHLEILEPEDLDALIQGKTIPVALPSCSFFLRIPYTPARRIIDSGLPLALASDFNPGSTPSGNMNFVASLGCIQLGMTPNESINACTINAAFCMEVDHFVGSITVGKLANFIITEPINSIDFLPYNFGDNSIDSVYIKGEKFGK